MDASSICGSKLNFPLSPYLPKVKIMNYSWEFPTMLLQLSLSENWLPALFYSRVQLKIVNHNNFEAIRFKLSAIKINSQYNIFHHDVVKCYETFLKCKSVAIRILIFVFCMCNAVPIQNSLIIMYKTHSSFKCLMLCWCIELK